MGNRAEWNESETESNGLAEREKEHWLGIGFGVGQKWPLVK